MDPATSSRSSSAHIQQPRPVNATHTVDARKGSLSRMASAARSVLPSLPVSLLPSSRRSLPAPSTRSAKELTPAENFHAGYYDARIAELEEREASALRVARAALALVTSQSENEGAAEPPAVWVQQEDLVSFESCLHRSAPFEVRGGPWVKVEVNAFRRAGLPLVSSMFTNSVNDSPRPDLVPFSRAFPLEVLENIIGLCSPKDQAAFSAASFACLQVFGPKLLRHVNITSFLNLLRLFANRDWKASSRLAPYLSLHLIKNFVVSATALEPSDDVKPQNRILWPSRLDERRDDYRLELKTLTIRMNFQNLEKTTKECYDRDPYDDDMSDVTGPDDDMSDVTGPDDSGSDKSEHSDDNEDDNEDNGERHRKFNVRTWRPCKQLFEMVAPRKLVFTEGRPEPRVETGPAFRVTIAAAHAIWELSNTRTIELHNLYLYVWVADGMGLEGDEEELASHPWEKPFFLTHGPNSSVFDDSDAGSDSGDDDSTSNLSKWTVRWVVDSLDTVKQYPWGARSGTGGYITSSDFQTLPAQLVADGGALQSERVEKVEIYVKNADVAAVVQADVDKIMPVGQRQRIKVVPRL